MLANEVQFEIPENCLLSFATFAFVRRRGNMMFSVTGCLRDVCFSCPSRHWSRDSRCTYRDSLKFIVAASDSEYPASV
jgi:hypothetical protein